MVRTLVIATAIGLAAATFIAARTASADNLVPGGWLQPIQLPKASPPPPPPAAEPAVHEPAPQLRRPIVRSRIKERRPPTPNPEATPSDGKVRF
jgi:hypothetical protein